MIAEAVRVLEGEGIVRAVRKRGTVIQWPVVRRRIERGNKVTRDPGYTAAGITAPGAAEPDTGPGGYLDRLEEAGHGPISWTEHVRARMPLPDEADLLQIAARAVVIEIARVGTSARTEVPVEVTICVIPAERVEIVSSLERDHTAQWPLSRRGTAQVRDAGRLSDHRRITGISGLVAHPQGATSPLSYWRELPLVRDKPGHQRRGPDSHPRAPHRLGAAREPATCRRR